MKKILLLFVLVGCDQHKPDHVCSHGDSSFMYQVTSRGLVRMQVDFTIDREHDIKVYENSDGVITIQILP